MLPIDHILWAAPDLEQGMATIEKLLGVEPIIGGVHPGGGTRNALLGLGNERYLEILGPDPAQDLRGTTAEWMPDLREPGLITWVVRTHDLDGVIAAAERLRVKTRGILSMSRKTPDGGELRWKVVRLSEHGFGTLVPFFIDWLETPHPSGTAPGGCTLESLRLTHPRADELRQFLKHFDIDANAALGSTPSLAATLECRKGRTTLGPAVPLPDRWRD